MDNFNADREAKFVTGLVDRAGRDVYHRPATYVSDVTKVSEELSKLTQDHLKETLAAIHQQDDHWYRSPNEVQAIEYDDHGNITGIYFNGTHNPNEPVPARIEASKSATTCSDLRDRK